MLVSLGTLLSELLTAYWSSKQLLDENIVIRNTFAGKRNQDQLNKFP